jgi:hypothetical protein
VKSLLCIEARGWKHVIEGAAGYLGEGEAIIACVIDERASLGYELAVKGLLGRRRPPDTGMATVTQATAERVLEDARAMLEASCPRLSVGTLPIRGAPNEALVKAGRSKKQTRCSSGAEAPQVTERSPSRRSCLAGGATAPAT